MHMPLSLQQTELCSGEATHTRDGYDCSRSESPQTASGKPENSGSTAELCDKRGEGKTGGA